VWFFLLARSGLDGKLFGRAISEVDDDGSKKMASPLYPQLNGMKDAIATGDLDPVMIPSASISVSPKKSQTCPRALQEIVAAKSRRQPKSTQYASLASILQRT